MAIFIMWGVIFSSYLAAYSGREWLDGEPIVPGTGFDYVCMDCKLQCSFTHGSFTYPSWLWVELSCKIDHNRYMTQGETPLITLLHFALIEIKRDFFFFFQNVPQTSTHLKAFTTQAKSFSSRRFYALCYGCLWIRA